MKQQVNLYQSCLYPVYEPLSLRRLMISLLSIVTVLALIWLYLQQQLSQHGDALTEAEQLLKNQQQESQLYQTALLQRKPDDALVKQQELLVRSVVQKQQLLAYLGTEQQQASQFYSPILAHLNQIDRPDLWLTSFELRQQYSSFNGIALQPASVTAWLEQLRQASYFKGQRFKEVNLQQVPERTAVSFELISQQGGRQ